jgi:hypothetical protein
MNDERPSRRHVLASDRCALVLLAVVAMASARYV